MRWPSPSRCLSIAPWTLWKGGLSGLCSFIHWTSTEHPLYARPYSSYGNAAESKVAKCLHLKSLTICVSETGRKRKTITKQMNKWKIGASDSTVQSIKVKWKKMKVKSVSCVRLFATLRTVAYQALPPSMGFSRQGYCSLPGSSIHGIFWARKLEWVANFFSRGSFQPRDQTQVSHIAGRFFTIWAMHLQNMIMHPMSYNL